MTNVSKKIRNRELPTDQEITETLEKANKNKNPYFRLRVRALIALLKKFGKRRAEIGSLKVKDLEVKEGYLFVTFSLRKKHKKGLFQYIKLLKRDYPEEMKRPLTEIQDQWRLWQQTEEGYRMKEEKRTKKVSLEDKYAKIILEYLEYLTTNYSNIEYLFSSGKDVFGTYFIDTSRPLSGRQLLRLIKPLNQKLWCHLFREGKGAEIAREEGDSIIGLTKVKQTLDLAREETAYHYIERYAIQEMKKEVS